MLLQIEMYFIMIWVFAIILSIFILLWFLAGIKIVLEYERIVVFRLGKFKRITGPGVVYVLPGLEKYIKVDMRIITTDIPRQEVISKDNIPILVNAVVFYRVEKPDIAIIKVRNYGHAVQQYTQAALRDVLGNMELDGILTERDQIAKEIKEIVDGEMDEWGIDVAITASQKGLGLPPGLAMVSLSSKAWRHAEQAKIPTFYFDFILARQSFYSGKGSAFTPAIPLIRAADFVLQEIRRKGLENVWKQRQKIAGNFRNKICGLGLKIFSDAPANSLTVFKIDRLNRCEQIPSVLKDQFNILVSRGQGKLANKVIRIGHLVNINETDLDRFLEAFQATITI